MTHGYMFSGSGSNVYVQNLCRALAGAGHEVHLLCQEPAPLSYDFVDAHCRVDGAGVSLLGERKTPYPGRCVVYNPEIGGLLPVYVYDEYPGWRVKTFLDLSEEELENYLASNAAAVRAVLGRSGAEAVITNHSVPGPLIARRALKGTGVPYLSIVHGSCLQYVARRSPKYMDLARDGLSGARRILALSSHSAGTVEEDLPELAGRTVSLPGGVDTQLFRPGALDPAALSGLRGGAGRGPEQREALARALREARGAEELNAALRSIAASYDARVHDRDAGERIGRLLASEGPLVVYVGKLIHSKGVHSLLSAFARVRAQTGARLLVVGYGTFREGLEALNVALGTGDETNLERLAELGKLLEGGHAGPLEHFAVSDGLLRAAEGMHDEVEFVGPLYHEELAKLLPAAEAGVVPSIFPETFGLVAAELAASGVVPFVADHSGLREAVAIVGRGLPFRLPVGMERFEEELAGALVRYLSLPVKERHRYRRIVRENTVRHLGWDTLADRLVELAREAQRR
ncbi:D-inositol-3-phosphate glycosyltransferase [Rubrobacter xylanophilus DSM 9941]|uniref:glycosyltransferase family 4 protein n=1 Tax=Rubrobacter xylanophilus TaxID=49319 RepID=UPI001C63F06F|nr:glycosyltransferase family 4 protein [Rubrobacter xylanophilus]QYJ14248.1 D-inositol-3-phosphate glycosyltransferase [Rubrobacter xylanophilus DSM 9941]